MKRYFLLLMVLLGLIWTHGCTSADLLGEENPDDYKDLDDEKEEKQYTDIDLTWVLDTRTEEDVNGTQVPVTRVSLEVDGVTEVIGDFLGYPHEIESMDELGLAETCISAYRTWFAGAGYNIVLCQVDDSTLLVQASYIDESDTRMVEYEVVWVYESENMIKDVRVKKSN